MFIIFVTPIFELTVCAAGDHGVAGGGKLCGNMVVVVGYVAGVAGNVVIGNAGCVGCGIWLGTSLGGTAAVAVVVSGAMVVAGGGRSFTGGNVCGRCCWGWVVGATSLS
jgi:hypothetical protein